MRGAPYVFTSFQGGVDYESAPYAIGPNKARDVLNVVSDPIGCIRKRLGCPRIAAPSAVPISLIPFEGGGDAMIFSAGTSLYKVTIAGAITQLKTGLTAGLEWTGIQVPVQGGQGPLIMMNGTDTPQYWDGISNATGDFTAASGTVPNGKYMVYHENRVYVAGVDSNPNHLYWSDIILPRNWASPYGGSTQFDPEDGLQITGLGKVGPYLLIFKENKTYLLLDSNTGAYRRISSDMGAIAARSIVDTEIGTFFISPEKEVIVTDGITFDRTIGIPVRQILKSVPGTKINDACASHLDKSFFLSISTGGVTNDTILEFDFITSAWWVHKIQVTSTTSTGVNAFARLNVSGDDKLYAAGADATNFAIYEIFAPNTFVDHVDQGFESQWTSPWITFEQPHVRKICRGVRVDALGAFDLYLARSFSTDFTQGETLVWEQLDLSEPLFGGTGLFGGDGTFGDVTGAITERRFYTPGTGRAWSVKFTSDSKQDLQIYGYTMQMDFRRD